MNPDFGTLEADVAEAVATADALNKPRIVGMGIYLELPKESNGQVTQILVTPEGTDSKNAPVPMAIISRTVAEWSPRAQWRVSFVRNEEGVELMTPMDKGLSMASQVEKFVKRQMSYGLTSLRKQPIVFELTDIDFSDITEWKAPAAALRRIQKARVALTFPEKLVK